MNPFLQRTWCQQTLLLTKISTEFRVIMSFCPRWSDNTFSFSHTWWSLLIKQRNPLLTSTEVRCMNTELIGFDRKKNSVLKNNVVAMQPLLQYLLESSVPCSQGTWSCSCKWQEQWNRTIFKEIHEIAVVCNYNCLCFASINTSLKCMCLVSSEH